MSNLSFTDKRFCVYSFSDEGGITYYIGSGTKYRTQVKGGRSKSLSAKMEESCVVTILYEDLSKDEALKIENSILEDYFNNKCNENMQLLNKSKSSKQREYKYSFFEQLFYYDPTSPTFLRWKVDRFGTGKAKIVKSGDVAGYISNDYAYVSVDYLGYSVHRIIYSLLNKIDVSNNFVIDHIDGDKLNNHISNLRLVTQQQNLKKKNKPNKLQSNNTSGIKGVYRLSTEYNEYWVCQYIDKVTNKRISKYFNIEKLGESVAFEKAFELRKANE